MLFNQSRNEPLAYQSEFTPHAHVFDRRDLKLIHVRLVLLHALVRVRRRRLSIRLAHRGELVAISVSAITRRLLHLLLVLVGVVVHVSEGLQLLLLFLVRMLESEKEDETKHQIPNNKPIHYLSANLIREFSTPISAIQSDLPPEMRPVRAS